MASICARHHRTELGPMDLAGRTGLVVRYIEERLAVRTCRRPVEYHRSGQMFTLPDEHAAVWAGTSTATRRIAVPSGFPAWPCADGFLVTATYRLAGT